MKPCKCASSTPSTDSVVKHWPTSGDGVACDGAYDVVVSVLVDDVDIIVVNGVLVLVELVAATLLKQQ